MKWTATTSLIALLACTANIRAQDLFPVSGGNSTESDPRNRKWSVLLAENPTVKLRLSKSEKYEKAGPVVAIVLKIENISDGPISIDPTRFSAIDNDGRGYAGLAPKEALQRILDSHRTAMWVIGAVAAGPLAGPGLTKEMASQGMERLNRDALQPGDVPPHSFKEGMVFFEAPQKKQKTLKITFTGLWPEPFVFTTQK